MAVAIKQSLGSQDERLMCSCGKPATVREYQLRVLKWAKCFGCWRRSIEVKNASH